MFTRKKPQGNFFKKPSQSFVKPAEKPNKKNFSRKYAEQQATKRFIHLKRKTLPSLNQKTEDKKKSFDSKREHKLPRFESYEC